LLTNPECREVHVFGSADPEWGERIVACIVGDKNQAKALIETAQTLPPFARPKDYLFVTKIPLDDRGKFDRRTAEKLLRG
ncbi:long-chain fatty acid--CoA ligase, partial [bacterium]|nr:long-chain fatty acid--CoA ligase [bacterium]